MPVTIFDGLTFFYQKGNKERKHKMDPFGPKQRHSMREISIVTGLTPSSGSETNLVAVHHSFAPWPPGWLAVSIGLSYEVGGLETYKT